MIKNMYTIKDNVSGLYNPPFLAINRGDAMRMLSNLVNDNNSTISQYPDDYALYQVGEWDEKEGFIPDLNNSYPEFIINANELVRNVA